MFDDPVIEPGPDVLDEVLVGDPLQLDDRDPGDVLQAVGDQPAVVEPAEPVLEAVVEGPEQERAADQAAALEDPGEQEGRRLGQQRPVHVDEGHRRGLARRSARSVSLIVVAFLGPARPSGRSGRPGSRASAASAASAITRTIGSVLLARTWTQRSSQSSRRPSRRSALASG